jgi:hypothetical protein
MLELRGVRVNRFMFNATSKSQLVGSLRKAIELQSVRIPTGEPFGTLVNELKDFDMVLGPTGREKYGAPSGLFDDCVIALALANWGAERGIAMPTPNTFHQGTGKW